MHTFTGRDLLPFLKMIRANTPEFLLECSRRYGDLVCFAPGAGIRAYFINHPDGIKQILQDNHYNYTKDTIQYNTLAAITGRGLLTADGESWLRHRRMQQPAFSRTRLAGLDRIIQPAVNAMLERWETAARNGSILDVDREMMQVTLEVVGKALFSIDLRTEAPRLTGAVLTALDHVIYKAQNLVTLPNNVPTPRNLKFQKALKTLNQAVLEILNDRQARPEAGDDLLGMLLSARDEETGKALSREQIRDEIITLLIAGHETVASALTWSWFLLAQHPNAWQTLHQEAITLPDDRDPTTTDITNLKYTSQVFNETLRLFPPAWLITRKSLREDTILGEKIPAGTLMIMSPYVIHRHPEFWSEPGEFSPQRFSDEAPQTWPRYAYIPFGGGPRLCIGNHFALIEGQMILSMVTRQYRLELPPGEKVKMDPLVTLRPHHGLPMRVIPV